MSYFYAFLCGLFFISSFVYVLFNIRKHTHIHQFSSRVFAEIIKRTKLIQFASYYFPSIPYLLALIYEEERPALAIHHWLGKLLTVLWCFIACGLLLLWCQVELFLIISCFISCFVAPMIMYRQLQTKVKKKQQFIMLELPKYISKVSLLLRAGETLKSAIVKSIPQYSDPQHPFISILNRLKYELANQVTFAEAIENVSKRCGLIEVTQFCSVLLLNERRGGDEVAISLTELSQSVWRNRKNVSKVIGEEASTKMLFPMMIIFVSVLIVITAPAILLMNEL